MTREEAIEQLQNCKGLIRQNGQDYLDERDFPLLDMAIESLKTEPIKCKDCIQRRVEGDCTHYYYCDFMGSKCGDNEYCSFGERREP